MKTYIVVLLVVAVVVVGVAFALIFSSRVGMCPSISGEDYRVLQMLKCANRVIGKGEEEAYRFLKREALRPSLSRPDRQRDERVALLCMTVYEPQAGAYLRGPAFGADNLPTASMPAEDWPRYPLVFGRGIPFLLVHSFNLAGPAEPASFYLEHCRKHGVFRDRPYHIPSLEEAESALSSLFDSSRWKAVDWQNAGDRCNEEDVKRRLRYQLEGLRTIGPQESGR